MWNAAGCVYITECKNLRFALTVGEIADQLNRFRGEAHDELSRHMRRYRWLSENPDRLSKVIGSDARLQIKPLLVSNTIVPMQFAQDLPIPVGDILPIGALERRIRRRQF